MTLRLLRNTPRNAKVSGIIVSAVCQRDCELRRRVLGRWLDDTLDVWGTHGVGRSVGAILVGVLSDPPVCSPGAMAVDNQGNPIVPPSWCSYPNGPARSGMLFGKQILVVLICAVWCVFVTWALLKLLSLVMVIKPQLREARKSIDEHEHENAYHSPTKVFQINTVSKPTATGQKNAVSDME